MSVLSASPTADVSTAPWPLSAALTGGSFTQGCRQSEVRRQAALESSLLLSQATTPLQSRLGGLQGRTAESHYCVLAFCKALDYFRGKSQWRDVAAPAQGAPGTAGSPQGQLAFVWRRARGSPHGPAPEECSLLQYFLSIHCRHFGKGWFTI